MAGIPDPLDQTATPDEAGLEAGRLDATDVLPARNRLALSLVLGVQMLNAFNDNFVKFLLISLAAAVAAHSALGADMELYLGAVFTAPYILFAPVAGFLSDRFSKRSVIIWTQVMQLGCLGWLAWAFRLRDPRLSLELGLGGFFVLATQATIFSPAKMGVLKELVGSRRLGRVSGWLQMTMMAGILVGMWAGGRSFDFLWRRSGDPWTAAWLPMVVVAVLCVGEIAASLFIMQTPPHPGVRFHRGVLWEHFIHVRALWQNRAIREAALAVAFFWFISNAVGVILVTVSKEMHPQITAESGMSADLASLAITLGVGVIAGSLVASAVCRRGIVLKLVPLGAFGFVAGLLGTGFSPVGSAGVYAGLVVIGFAGGCYMVPLYAFVQDRAAPDERARILAAMNLLDCFAGVAAMAIVFLMKWAGMKAGVQLAVLGVPALLVAFVSGRLQRWLK